jgi:glucose/mannose-6-phosphate isomerase
MDDILTPLSTFKEQFHFIPEVKYPYAETPEVIVICGMGGSLICGNLLKLLFPELPVTVHNSYGLPSVYNKTKTLFIFNSYSGNTEEILDGYDKAKKESLLIAVISKGGELLRHAEEDGVPHIALPESTLEPRFSIGHQLLALLTIMKEDAKANLLRDKASKINMEQSEQIGKHLAEHFKGLYPVIYSSSLFHPASYLIKAAINEGAKIPSFVHIIPEANHNELQSYTTSETVHESSRFGFLYLISQYDHVRIQKRFTIMQSLYENYDFTQSSLTDDHTNITSVFELIMAGYYMATYMALTKKINPYTTPLIAAFKNEMK